MSGFRVQFLEILHGMVISKAGGLAEALPSHFNMALPVHKIASLTGRCETIAVVKNLSAKANLKSQREMPEQMLAHASYSG